MTPDPEAYERTGAVDLRFVARLIGRRAGLILFCLFVGLSCGVYYVRTAVPEYVSSAKLLIEAPHGPDNWSEANSGAVVDSAQVESQVEILRALTIAEQVVRRLDLVSDPEFVPTHSADVPFAPLLARAESAAARFPAIRDAVQELIAYLHPDPPPRSADEAFRTAVSSFGERISVRRLGQSDVIEVDFAAASPVKAARIVSETIDAYLRGTWRQDASPGAFHRFNDSVMRNSLAVTNARLISAAMPPLGRSSPKTSLALAFAIALSLFVGLSLALWLEARHAARLRNARIAVETGGAYDPMPLREGARAEVVSYSLKDSRK